MGQCGDLTANLKANITRLLATCQSTAEIAKIIKKGDIVQSRNISDKNNLRTDKNNLRKLATK